jgi:osmotically-inducible protein OsmY
MPNWALLAAKAETCLKVAQYLDLRHISCRCRDGVVTLRGRVPTYYMKQMAQILVGSLEGVQRVSNELLVSPLPPRFERD